MAERIFKGGEYLVAEVTKDDVFTPEDFTDEQRQIAETTEQFVTNEILPHAEEIEAQNFDLVVEGMRKAGELGLLMIDAPEEYGGLDLDKATSMLVGEKIGSSGSFSVAFAAHTGIGTLPLIYYGTKEQKERYLEKIITGEWIAAYCLTEPESGSDALGAQATATLSADGKYYLLNGTKQFITNGGFANLFTVFAKIDKEHFTAFLVERDLRGGVGRPRGEEAGHQGLLDLPGPPRQRQGAGGERARRDRQGAQDRLQRPQRRPLQARRRGHRGRQGRPCRSASSTPTSASSSAAPSAPSAPSSEKIADLTADLFASESLVYRLAGLLDTKLVTLDPAVDNYYEEYQKGIEEYAPECAIAKVFCSDVLADVVDEVVQIHGGYGFVSEYPAERFYRDERINRIFEGTNEINRLLIPGMILRKAMKGELPLQKEAMKAFESLMTPSFEEIDESVPFAREKALLKNLKTLFHILSGAAVRKYLDRLADEQEILLAAADMAIQIFALESVVLRAEKALPGASDNKRALLEAATKVFAFKATEVIGTAAKKGAFYLEEGDTLTMILSGVRRFAKYDASGLLAAKRRLAKAAIEAEKYIF